MTERVDLDRLADFVGGALDGTPDADAVRDLIAGDAAWESAYADLVTADAAVRLDLAEYAAQDTRMPDDVADRLASVLRSPGSSSEKATARETRDTRRPASRTDATRPGASRRRARLYAGLSAVTAVALVAFGLLVGLPRVARDGIKSNSDTAGAPAPGGQAEAAVDTPQQISGRDYRRGDFGTLGNDANAPGAAAARSSERGGPNALGGAAEQPGFAGSTPPELQRLLTPTARAACIQAIQAIHGGIVRLVDYARFEGRPALVALLDGTRDGGAGSWVVVVGPDCGQPTGNADERYSGPIA
ncbi:hypothetical protein Val02_77100 [Virgisporangium aliadipatigenens]|uniref:Uncharacterized protein n=1 Tax=Virgisporangium aliadipatigenens TaxID=741659 RepID=A0A8J3YS29_9ACTN|nr:hypothetical protein [Virgisporangium aliadipatigenens]GIJ50824.1 hypothetical protein Val02_77100 [Virgisporangium aliadipatigenens]